MGKDERPRFFHLRKKLFHLGEKYILRQLSKKCGPYETFLKEKGVSPTALGGTERGKVEGGNSSRGCWPGSNFGALPYVKGFPAGGYRRRGGAKGVVGGRRLKGNRCLAAVARSCRPKKSFSDRGRGKEKKGAATGGRGKNQGGGGGGCVGCFGCWLLELWDKKKKSLL